MEEFMLDYLREEFAAYSNELIIIGVLIIAFVSFYSRFFLKSSKKKKRTNRLQHGRRARPHLYLCSVYFGTDDTRVSHNSEKPVQKICTPKHTKINPVFDT